MPILTSTQSLTLLACLFLLSASCVSNKKYDSARMDSTRYKMERDSLKRVADESRYVEYNLERSESKLKKQTAEMEALKESFTALNRNYKDLLGRFDEMIFQNQTLLDVSSEEKQSLTQELATKQLELDKRERDLRRLEYDLQQKEAQLGQVNSDVQEDKEQQRLDCEQRLSELYAMIQAKDAGLAQLRSKINQALLGFSDSDLTVSESNGKIYVSLSQNLLFASNSDKVDWKGKTAIKKVAEVLSRNPDIEINVEGHTDADGSAEKNWDLSVRRATAVVKTLVTYGVNPKQVVASGRSFYLPIASNATTTGKAKNRRTEIILSPRLDELYQLINQ
ncbi:MAG: OmpA family protein [Bacteroidota bacterium]